MTPDCFPDWWEWPLELTPHIEKRMEERGFSEIDLRTMVESPRKILADRFKGRWIIQCHHRNQGWEVIVEPDQEEQLIVVITAYRKENL